MSGDDPRAWNADERVGDPKHRTEHPNEVNNHEGLSAKVAKQLVACQPKRGVTKAGGKVTGRI